MAHSVTEGKDWRRMSKLSAIALVALGVAFVVGLYAVAPTFQRGADTHFPASLAEMPAALVRVETPDNGTAALLVRIADTTGARTAGLRNVGADPLSSTIILYDQRREVRTRTTYQMAGIRAPLEIAVVQLDGTVALIQPVAQDANSVAVQIPHRWVFAARQGILSGLGIVEGARLLTEEITRLPS